MNDLTRSRQLGICRMTIPWDVVCYTAYGNLWLLAQILPSLTRRPLLATASGRIRGLLAVNNVQASLRPSELALEGERKKYKLPTT